MADIGKYLGPGYRPDHIRTQIGHLGWEFYRLRWTEIICLCRPLYSSRQNMENAATGVWSTYLIHPTEIRPSQLFHKVNRRLWLKLVARGYIHTRLVLGKYLGVVYNCSRVGIDHLADSVARGCRTAL